MDSSHVQGFDVEAVVDTMLQKHSKYDACSTILEASAYATVSMSTQCTHLRIA